MLKRWISDFIVFIFLFQVCLFDIATSRLITEDRDKSKHDRHAFTSTALLHGSGNDKVRSPALSDVEFTSYALYKKTFNPQNRTVLNLSEEQTQQYYEYKKRISKDLEWISVVDSYVYFLQCPSGCTKEEFDQALFYFLFKYDTFFKKETQFGIITFKNEPPHYLPIADRVLRRKMIPIVLIDNAQIRLIRSKNLVANVTFAQQMQREEIENGERVGMEHVVGSDNHKIPYMLHLLTRNVDGIKQSLGFQDQDISAKGNEPTIDGLTGLNLHAYEIYHTSRMYTGEIGTESYQQISVRDVSKLGKSSLNEYDNFGIIHMLKQSDLKTTDVFLNVGLIKHGFYDMFLRKKGYNYQKLKNPPARDLDDSEYHYSVFHEYQREDVKIFDHFDTSREGMASNFLYLLGIPTPEIYFYSHSTIYMEMIQDKKTADTVGKAAIDLSKEFKNEIYFMRSMHEVSLCSKEFGDSKSRDMLWSLIRNPDKISKHYITKNDTELGYKQYMEIGIMLMIDLCLGNLDRFLGGFNPGNTLIDGTGTLNFIDTVFSVSTLLEMIVYNFLHESLHFIYNRTSEDIGVDIERREGAEDVYFMFYTFLCRMILEYATTGEISFVRRLFNKEERMLRYNTDGVSCRAKFEFASVHIPGHPFLTHKDNKDYIVRSLSEGMVEGLLLIGRKFDPFYFTNFDQKLQEKELEVIRKIFSQAREFVARYIPDDVREAHELWTGEVPSTFKNILYVKTMGIADTPVFRTNPEKYRYRYISPELPIDDEAKFIIFEVEEGRWYFVVEDGTLNKEGEYDTHLGSVVFRPNGDIVLQFSSISEYIEKHREILITSANGKYLGIYPHYPGHEASDANLANFFAISLKGFISDILYNSGNVNSKVKIEEKNKVERQGSNKNIRRMLMIDDLADKTRSKDPLNLKDILKTYNFEAPGTYPTTKALDDVKTGYMRGNFYRFINRVERYVAKTDQVKATIPLSYKIDVLGLYEDIRVAFDTVFENKRLQSNPNNMEDEAWKVRKIILDRYLMLLEEIERNIKLGHTLSSVQIKLDSDSDPEFSEDQKFLEGNRRGIKIGFYIPNKDVAHIDVLTVLSVIADKRLDKVIWLPSTQEEEEILKDSLSMYGELFAVAKVPALEGQKVNKDDLFHHMLKLNADRRMDSYYIQQNAKETLEYLQSIGQKDVFFPDLVDRKEHHKVYVVLCDLDDFFLLSSNRRSEHFIDSSIVWLKKNVLNVNVYGANFLPKGIQGGRGVLSFMISKTSPGMGVFLKHTELFYELKDIGAIDVKLDNFHLFLHDYSKRLLKNNGNDWSGEQILKYDDVVDKHKFLDYTIQRAPKPRDEEKIISSRKLMEEEPRYIQSNDHIEALKRSKIMVDKKSMMYQYTDAEGKRHVYFIINISKEGCLQNAIYFGRLTYLEDKIEYLFIGDILDKKTGRSQSYLIDSIQKKESLEGHYNYNEMGEGQIRFCIDLIDSLKGKYEFLGQIEEAALDMGIAVDHKNKILNVLQDVLGTGMRIYIPKNIDLSFLGEGRIYKIMEYFVKKIYNKSMFLSTITAEYPSDVKLQAIGHEVHLTISSIPNDIDFNANHFILPSSIDNRVHYSALIITISKNSEGKHDKLFFSFIGPDRTEFANGMYQGLIEIIAPGHVTVYMFTENTGLQAREYVHVYNKDYLMGEFTNPMHKKVMEELVVKIADAMAYGFHISDYNGSLNSNMPEWLHNKSHVLSKITQGEEFRLQLRNFWNMGVGQLTSQVLEGLRLEDLPKYPMLKTYFNRMIEYGIGTAFKHIQDRDSSQIPIHTLIKDSDIKHVQYEAGIKCHLFSVKGKEEKRYFVFQGPGVKQDDVFYGGLYYGYATKVEGLIHVILIAQNPLFPHNTAYILPSKIQDLNEGISVFVSLFSDPGKYDLLDVKLYTLSQNTKYNQDINRKSLDYIGLDASDIGRMISNNTPELLTRIANVIQDIDATLQHQ